GPGLFDLAPRAASGIGPVVVPDVGAVALDPVPLTGLLPGSDSDTLNVFVKEEQIVGTPLNADADTTDPVLTLQDRVGGAPLPIGAAGAPGRAVARIADGVFHFPAVAAEGDVVVFLEPEALEGPPKGTGGMDRTGDGLVFQTMLRVV